MDYTLLEGRFGRADVRPVLTLPEMGMYPRILGTTADGLTLAAESDRALVTFPGADAERVRTRFTVEQPPHASTASLALSPDGKRLAWFVQRLPVFEPTSPLLRLLEPRTPNRKTREGASVAYTAELTTSGAGPFRMVGGVDYATSGGEVDFWWAPDSRGIYFSHYSPSGRRYYRVSLP